VDAYVIVSQTVRHQDLIPLVAPLGRPIFADKPLGTSRKAAESLAKLLQKHNAVFHTGYFQRGSAEVQTINHWVKSGRFGQITRARMSNCHSGALGGWFDTDYKWMTEREQAGCGAYGDLGSHGVDLLMWMFGDVEQVVASVAPGTDRYPGCDEVGEGILKFKSGVIATLAASWDDVASPYRLQIAGAEGHAILGDDLRWAGKDGRWEVVTDLEPAAPAGFAAFLDHLEGNNVPLISPAEAAARTAVVQAIYESVDKSKWVKL
jgi:predicted dehydrogenase